MTQPSPASTVFLRASQSRLVPTRNKPHNVRYTRARPRRRPTAWDRLSTPWQTSLMSDSTGQTNLERAALRLRRARNTLLLSQVATIDLGRMSPSEAARLDFPESRAQRLAESVGRSDLPITEATNLYSAVERGFQQAERRRTEDRERREAAGSGAPASAKNGHATTSTNTAPDRRPSTTPKWALSSSRSTRSNSPASPAYPSSPTVPNPAPPTLTASLCWPAGSPADLTWMNRPRSARSVNDQEPIRRMSPPAVRDALLISTSGGGRRSIGSAGNTYWQWDRSQCCRARQSHPAPQSKT